MATIYASPDGKPAIVDGRERMCRRLENAMDALSAGDELRLAPGVYDQPVKARLDGERGQPIRISTAGDVTFDGKRKPVSANGWHQTPDETDFYFMFLHRSSHVELSGIRLRNCWPNGFLLRGCHDIAFRDIDAIGGQHVIFARALRGGLLRPTIHSRSLTCLGCQWTQDPDRMMWEGAVSWKAVKSRKKTENARRFNGALLGGYDILGDVLLERCRISHAFNGFRVEAPEGAMADRNVDLRVIDCDFDHIRDNAIEPETYCLGLWVQGCRFTNIHAVFSLHHVRGGFWYIFGNTILGLEKPKDKSNTGGKIIKLKNGPTPEEGPFVFVHNSQHVLSRHIKDGRTTNLIHGANILSFIDPDQPIFSTKDNPVEGDRQFFLWDASYRFEGDVSNHTAFPDKFDPERGFDIRGHHVERPLSDPANGDWSPRAGSPIAPGDDGQVKIPPAPQKIPLPGRAEPWTPTADLVGARQASGEMFSDIPYAPIGNWGGIA